MDKKFSPRSISSATMHGLAEAAEADSSSSKNPIKVTFSPSPVKTGYRTDVDPSPIKVTVTATVDPKSETKNITFAKEGVDRFSYTDVSRDESKGEIKLEVKGTSPTDPLKRGGDSTLVAKDKDGNKVGEVKVIVKIPKRIGTPHPTFDGTVTGENLAVNSSTTPPEAQVAPPLKALATYYRTPLTITVWDQFGAALDGLYAGAPVEERLASGTRFFPMNVKMSASGTYVDSVGFGYLKTITIDGQTGVEVADGSTPAGKDRILQWATQDPPLPLTAHDDTTDLDVRIGGHVLDPAPAINHRRMISTNPPPHLKVEWP